MPALDEIVAATRVAVAQRKSAADMRAFERLAARHVPRGFGRRLQMQASVNGVAIIAELKQASPSKGVLRSDLDAAVIAREYEQAGAAALSVLTEEQYFKGSLENLRRASNATKLPCLRKDFIIHEFQILEARANSADAILLIAACLTDAELRRLYASARQIELDVLCEVHDEQELERVLACGCDIVGVNNRDLRSFRVDLATAEKLAARIPQQVLKVAESGIHTADDIARLRTAGFNHFLIGESLITQPSPGQALRDLLATVERHSASESRA